METGRKQKVMFLKCTWLPAYLRMTNTQEGRSTTAMALILCPWLCSPRELEFISPLLGLVTSSGQQQVGEVRAAKPELALRGQVWTLRSCSEPSLCRENKPRRACLKGERLQETERRQ